MTQEDKDLLFTDLCARLPYEVKVQVFNCSIESVETLYQIDLDGYISTLECNELKYSYKPYLFPLSSMTEEQRKELQELYFDYIPDEIFNDTEFVYHYDCMHLINWLNKNHFDYRGLIEKGLALDASNLNIYNNDTGR